VACGGAGSVTSPPSTEPAPSPAPAAAAFVRRFGDGWKTDFTQALVTPDVFTVGQTKDGIPAIDAPRFIPPDRAIFLDPREPVIALEVNGDARAYPLRILIWHEIVNDTVGGVPVMVTFCPLCNTSIVFERVVDGRTLDFGTTGLLRNSDLVMYDRQTESWWQQITGEALVGEMAGARLEIIPSAIVAWADFVATYPFGMVLSQDTGFDRPYGRNPYVGYDRVDQNPFLFEGEPDPRLLPMERVVTVEMNGETVAYPFSRLEANPVVYDTVGGTEIVVLFEPGAVSALDRSAITESRDVGSTGVFIPQARGRRLTLAPEDEGFVDRETGSRWNVLGLAVDGPLAGERLSPVAHGNHFWFAWAAFKPETRIWAP
ncbi:MAG TPA: DUF3179 domain-containing protein, partial [Dehalococcoidia bacterium]|nr:DUF3179 domain-containing protein [Dehalococcoidia bacterium]